MRRLLRFLLVLALVGLALRLAGVLDDPFVRVATFNIRNFPDGPRQEEGAFEAIRSLGAPIVALQEIVGTAEFAQAVQARLGGSWRVVWAAPCPEQTIGVLFDGSRFELLSTKTHPDTIIFDGTKPAFEARLRARDGGEVLRVVVVHLKAGGDSVDVRARQIAGLEAILARLGESGERIVLLGDFNATGDADRTAIGALAEKAELEWASEDVECTSYWEPDGCRGSALDQVLASDDADVLAEGPCREVGCAPGDQCPVFFHDVSDHCPVTADLW